MKAHTADSACYQCGTLHYTGGKLILLFFWLLLGDFVTTLSTTALPVLLPLYLKQLDFSTLRIGWFLSIGYIVCMVVSPFLGMRSDRTRTRWGRRRPYILGAVPFSAAGLMLIPFIHSFWLLNVVVILISLASAVSGVTFYLYNDVIPPQLMGRFVGAFRFVGFLGALAFQYGLLPYFDQYPTQVWITVGAVSLVFNLIMVVMVREGEYPPPEPAKPFSDNVRTFIREGLGSPFMWMLWLTLGMTALGGPAASYFVLYFEDTLGMSSGEIGHMMAWGTVVAMVLALPCGWLVDKVGANLVWGCGGAAVALAQIGMFFFIKDLNTCRIWYLVYYGINMIFSAALLPMIFTHLPREKFGQLVSCQMLVSQGLLFLGTNGFGWLIAASGDHYKLCMLLGGGIYLLSPVFLLLMLLCRNPFAGRSAGAASPEDSREAGKGEEP